MIKQKIIDIFTETIRQKGYSALSIADISKKVGVNKSSLYHYFQGGKSEMAITILRNTQSFLSQSFEAGLSKEKTPYEKFNKALDILDKFYNQGQANCLIDVMSLDPLNDDIKSEVKNLLNALLDVFETLFKTAASTDHQTRQKAIYVITLLQGSLVLARTMDDPSLFRDQVAFLREVFPSKDL